MNSVFFALLLVCMLPFAGCAIGIPVPRTHAADSTPYIIPSARCAVIRQRLLAITPPGTPASQIVAFVSRELRAHGETDEHAITRATTLWNGPGWIPRPSCEARGWHYTKVGSKSISVSFESPSFSLLLGIPVATKNVAQVCYVFNARGELLDVGVSTFVNGLS